MFIICLDETKELEDVGLKSLNNSLLILMSSNLVPPPSFYNRWTESVRSAHSIVHRCVVLVVRRFAGTLRGDMVARSVRVAVERSHSTAKTYVVRSMTVSVSVVITTTVSSTTSVSRRSGNRSSHGKGR